MNKGTVIDGVYTLLDQIAEGGMAVVHRASVNLDAFDYTRLYAYTQVKGRTHAERQQRSAELAQSLAGQKLDRDTIRAILQAHSIPLPPPMVAVKVAKANMDPLRFEAEWRNLLCLGHPNVIKVYGGGTWLGRPYYAMELLEGLIDPELIANTFSLAHKLRILADAGRGLAFLHENGLVHRDVKPENFLTCRTSAGEFITLVSDLGIAKTIDGSPGLTQTEQMMGTPYYMSPEQVRSSRDVDARADIYSMGATLYAMVLGVPPFHNKTTLFEIIASVTVGEPPIPPKQHSPNLPDDIDAIIRCAMAYAVEDRYQTMNDLVADLEVYVQRANPQLLASINLAALPPDASLSGTPYSGTYHFESLLQGRLRPTAPVVGTVNTPNLPATVGSPGTVDVPPTSSVGVAPQPKRRPIGLWIAVGLGGFVMMAIVAAVLVLVLTTILGDRGGGSSGDGDGTEINDSAGLIRSPSTPAEHYHNARIHEKNGDLARARESYVAVLKADSDHIDPHLDYQHLLREQDGIESARSAYIDLGQGNKSLNFKAASLLLEPREQRNNGLESLAKTHPDFAPADYLLSLEYSKEKVGNQTIVEKRREWSHLKRADELDRAGKLQRYFLSKERGKQARDDIRARLKVLESMPREVLLNPVRLGAMKSNQGWMVTLQLADYQVKELFYRVGPAGPFRSTGHSPTVNMQTGLPQPNVTIDLPLSQPRTQLYVKMIDIRDQVDGPFELLFDPQGESLRSAKHILNMTASSWVSFRDYSGKRIVYFTHLLSYRDAMQEIRYSLDQPTLEKRFPLLPPDPLNRITGTSYLEVRDDRRKCRRPCLPHSSP
jgi:serine/threonine protein kinase